MHPGLSRIYTKALWLLPTTRQRGYPHTCVHNADHLLVKSDTKSPFGTRQKKNCLGKYKAFHVCGLLSANHKSWEWLRLKFNCTPGKRMMLVHPECDFTSETWKCCLQYQIQGFFVKVLNSCHEVQWCWPSLFGVLHNVPIWNQAEEKLLAPTLMTSTHFWKKMMLIQHEIDITSKHEKGSNHVTGLGHWICW